MRAFESITFAAPAPGPRLIVTAAVHGNETCGTVAIRRLLGEMERTFAEQHRRLSERDRLSLDVDMEVLDTRLKQHGPHP